jgi:hypothetical protein
MILADADSWFKSMRHLSLSEAGGEVERADRGPVRVRGLRTANLASQIARPPHPDLAERLLRRLPQLRRGRGD